MGSGWYYSVHAPIPFGQGLMDQCRQNQAVMDGHTQEFKPVLEYKASTRIVNESVFNQPFQSAPAFNYIAGSQ